MKLRHKIQHYLTITDKELRFLLVVSGILLLGLILKLVQQHNLPDYSVQYALIDSLVAEAEKNSEDSTFPPESDSNQGEMPININTADMDHLTKLPGIGPAIARRIIDYRERYGPFSRKEDLMHVRGIGPRTMESLRLLISV